MQVAMCESTAHVPPEILQTVQQHLEETARTSAPPVSGVVRFHSYRAVLFTSTQQSTPRTEKRNP